MTSSKMARTAREAKRWLEDQIVEEVPDGVALCEFGCRKLQCRMGEWEHCERRLKDLESRRQWEAAHS